MVKRLLGDRRGIALAFPVLLIILLAFTGLVLDIGRSHIIRGQLQTIADSASLAGAMTAEVKYDSEFQETYEKDYVDLKQTFVNPQTVITDTQKAKESAVDAALANSPDWSNMGVAALDQGYNGNALNGNGYAGHVTNQTRNFPGVHQTQWPGYYSEMRVKTNPGFLRFLQDEQLPIHVEAESIPILRPDAEKTRAGAEMTLELPADVEGIKENLRNDPSSYWNPN